MLEVDVSGLDKASVLAALVNNGRNPLYDDENAMTVDEAQELIDDRGQGSLYFDYVEGVPIKVNLQYDDLNSVDYDRENGAGLMKRVIDNLRATNSIARIQ